MTFSLPTASTDRTKRTDDPAQQAELLRQGWIQDDEPTYDPATQHPPVRENRQWVVRDKTEEELAAELTAWREALPILDFAPFWIMLSRNSKNGKALDEAVHELYVTMPESQERKEFGYWMNNSRYARTHPMLARAGELLGLTPNEIDAMWPTE